MNSTEYREYMKSLEPAYHAAITTAAPLTYPDNTNNQFVLTWDNGIDSFRETYELDLDKAIRNFEYWSRSDANSHTIYPATVEILFNGIVIRSYGN